MRHSHGDDVEHGLRVQLTDPGDGWDVKYSVWEAKAPPCQLGSVCPERRYDD